MKIFQEKRRFRSRLYSKTALFIILIVVILLAKGVFDVYGRYKESVLMRTETEAKLLELETQRANIAKESAKLLSEAGIDAKIRTKFNVAKPGENVVLIVDDATTTATTTPGFFATLWAKIWR